MTVDPSSSTLGAVLAELGPSARLAAGEESQLGRPVRSTVLFLGPEDMTSEQDTILLCPGIQDSDSLREFISVLPVSPARMIILMPKDGGIPAQELLAAAGEHMIVEVVSHNVADVVLTVGQSLQAPEESVARRLSSLQRALSQSMTEAEPLPALLGRLARVCNATVAVVDRSGRWVNSTGPLPSSLLFEEVARTEAASQRFDVDGWRGVAARISGPAQEALHSGWLIAATRRINFPDTYATSAVHVAATLVEASQKIANVARLQERAIRTSVLEEALALRREPNNPELAGRLFAFGLSFVDELRCIVYRPLRPRVSTRSAPALEEVAEVLARDLHASGVAHLMTIKEQSLTLLLQCSAQTFRRALVAGESRLPAAHVGVGRRIHSIGDVPDSYQDALLAIRTLIRHPKGSKLMAYEDFDYATRLFADIGFNKMTAWAGEFLRPLEGRELLIDGLRTYFEHNQNINTAADSLNIHHNSLRYRLAKIEEMLDVSLRDPAAVSSVFLALTALDLGKFQQSVKRAAASAASAARPYDVEAPDVLPYVRQDVDRTGVVGGPGR